jgi:hypothetical protein
MEDMNCSYREAIMAPYSLNYKKEIEKAENGDLHAMFNVASYIIKFQCDYNRDAKETFDETLSENNRSAEASIRQAHKRCKAFCS